MRIGLTTKNNSGPRFIQERTRLKEAFNDQTRTNPDFTANRALHVTRSPTALRLGENAKAACADTRFFPRNR